MVAEWFLNGIQQVGIGVVDLGEWKWYRRNLGFDVPIFRDAGPAAQMAHYTGGRIHEREALLAINTQGGGGVELWAFRTRQPVSPAFQPQLGDRGIFAPKLGCTNIQRAFKEFGNHVLSPNPTRDPGGYAHFFVRNPAGLPFQVTEIKRHYLRGKTPTSGVCGAIIGVSDIDLARQFYSGLLGYDTVLYEETRIPADFVGMPGGDQPFRRVALEQSKSPTGAFGHFFGPSRIELLETLDDANRNRPTIYYNRYWGDLGFIHLCFDINRIDNLRIACQQAGFPFTVDSGPFTMGESSGQFAYVEDPDGTLIEFVETHSLPIVKRPKIKLNLRRRNIHRPLPKMMLRLLRLLRVHD